MKGRDSLNGLPARDRAAELAALRKNFDQLHEDLQNWNLAWGPFCFRARFGTQRLAAVFVGFHVLAASVGTVLIFLGGAAAQLGTALMVGALFGFGAFLAQVWTAQLERERWLQEDEFRRRYTDLKHRWEITVEAYARDGSQ